MEIVVAGHICLDIIPEWNRGGIASIIPGHIIEMEGIKFSTGGAVANTGLALVKLGIKTGLIGKIGNDAIGKIILGILEESAGDITQNMVISEEETSSYTVVINPPDVDRAFLHYPGTNHTFSSADIPFQKIEEAAIFHFGYPPIMKQFYSGEGEEMAGTFKKVKELGMITSLDTAMPDPDSPAGKLDWKRYFKNVLPHVDIFHPSIDELLFMLGMPEQDLFTEDGLIDTELLGELGDILLDWGVGIAVIKLGDSGLYLQSRGLVAHQSLSEIINPEEWSEQRIIAPCFSAEISGTTGSGDATVAGFLTELSRGSAPAEVMTVATAVGAFSVEAVDATGGIKSYPEVKERLEQGWEKLPVKIADKDWYYDRDFSIWRREENKLKSDLT